jgi:hypothetical protein
MGGGVIARKARAPRALLDVLIVGAGRLFIT